MTKITKESIKEHLLSKGWKKENNLSMFPDYWYSPNHRYTLFSTDYSNLTSECECGWRLVIDDSRGCSLATCDVEYIEQIFTLIDIYKDY